MDTLILDKVDGNKSQSQISKELNLHQEKVRRTLQKLEKEYKIRRISKTPAIYERIPEEERERLIRDEKGVIHGPFSIHSVSFKYPILNGGNFDLKKKIKMNNWDKSVSRLDNATIEKSENNIIITPKVDIRGSPEELLVYAENLSNVFASKLMKEHKGLVLGAPSLSRKPHYVVEDIDIKFDSQVTAKEWHIDDSDNTGSELEITDVESVYKLMKFINDDTVLVPRSVLIAHGILKEKK